MMQLPDHVSLGFSALADSGLWHDIVQAGLLLLFDGETRFDVGELCDLSDSDIENA